MSLRFAADLTGLFTELPFKERFAAAKEAGFDAVELPFPYEASATDTRTALIMAGVDMALMCAPPPNWTGGARGFAAVPEVAERFRRDLDRALRYADVLKARHLCLVAGPAPAAAGRATLVANLAWATERAPKRSFLIEPVAAETGDFLTSYALAAEIVAQVGAPNLGLLFDLWHADRIAGDPVKAWDQAGPLVRHVQISGLPDRTDPPGSFDLASFLDRIAADGYKGFVGAEYLPAGHTRAGLGWMAAAG